jgi:hypothetical protein
MLWKITLTHIIMLTTPIRKKSWQGFNLQTLILTLDVVKVKGPFVSQSI